MPELAWNVFLLLVSSAIVLWGLAKAYARKLRFNNHSRRTAVFRSLGLTRVDDKRTVGYFHPYCNAGGGGERVLWTAIAAVQRTKPDVIHVVYSGDGDASKEEILDKVKARFNISLDASRLHFVFLRSRSMVEDSTWPRFTLLGQSIGSMYLAWEAMSKLIPDLYIDTMGYAFTFRVVSILAGIPVGAYVHYPTISTDMLARVKSRKEWHTNTDTISSSSFLSWGKLLYYRLFMYYYAASLRTASFLMVNSSWTRDHVNGIIRHADPILDAVHSLNPLNLLVRNPQNPELTAQRVYPPCDTKEMAAFPLEGRERVILSVAQFRPEKDHPTQLRAFHSLLHEHPEYRENAASTVRLVLIGGCRNPDDLDRLDRLRRLATELGIESQVEFIVNAPYSTVLFWLSKASIGLSTMVDEHFGINVVEFMASGVIPVTHASGGPLKDIVVPFKGQVTGYLASDQEDFASSVHKVLSLSVEDELAMRQRARSLAIEKFSEHEFEVGWESSGWYKWLGRTR